MVDGYNCHALEFYYQMKLLDNDTVHCRETTDDGEQLVWLPLDDIPNAKIKPPFISERLDEILNTNNTLHIIEERER